MSVSLVVRTTMAVCAQPLVVALLHTVDPRDLLPACRPHPMVFVIQNYSGN